jgi:hypothetical protein
VKWRSRKEEEGQHQLPLFLTSATASRNLKKNLMRDSKTQIEQLVLGYMTQILYEIIVYFYSNCTQRLMKVCSIFSSGVIFLFL